MAANLHLFHGSVGIEGYGGVEEEVAVYDGVHGAVLKHGADMAAKLVADAEGVHQAVDELFFLIGEAVGVGGVNGGGS